jgi:hypothetical protein
MQGVCHASRGILALGLCAATLVEVFDRERAVDLIWYVCWCNYMTRAADAFQLPLEKGNCFMH